MLRTLFDFVPDLLRLIATFSALLLGWAVTAGLTLSLIWAVWLGLHEGAVWVWNVLHSYLDQRPSTSWIPDSPPPLVGLLFDWTPWIVGPLTLLAYLRLTFSTLKGSVRRIVGSQVTKVERDSNLGTLFRQVHERSGLRRLPSFWLAEGSGPTAFAISAPFGRRAVVMSPELIRALTADEVAWVMAHELGHLHYRDTDSSSLWITGYNGMLIFERVRVRVFNVLLRLVRAFPLLRILTSPLRWSLTLLVRLGGLGRWFARQAFLLLDRWAGRMMEYRADSYASSLLGPEAGIRVLEKLQGGIEPRFGNLFATHPPLKRRARRLASTKAE